MQTPAISLRGRSAGSNLAADHSSLAPRDLHQRVRSVAHAFQRQALRFHRAHAAPQVQRRHLAVVPCASSSSAAGAGQSQQQSIEQSTSLGLTLATAATVGLSAVLAIVPSRAFCYGVSAVPTVATQSLLQHVGVSTWPVAAILYVLGDAARNQRLSSDTYQRLASYVAIGFGALAVYSAAAIGDLDIAWRNLTAAKSLAFAFFAVPALSATAAISAGPQAKDASSSWLGTQAKAVRNAATKLTAGNKSGEGTLYQGLTFLLPLGLPLLVFRSTLGGWLWPPEAISQLGPVHALLLKVVTLESVGGAVAAFSMKDAENRGRLGGGTFKVLRASLVASAAGHVAVAALGRSAADSTLNKAASAGLAGLVALVALRWLGLEAKRFEKK